MTTVCLVMVEENRSEPEVLTRGARLLQQIQPNLKEFHTRTMKVAFREKLSRLSSVAPAVRFYLYRHLTGEEICGIFFKLQIEIK